MKRYLTILFALLMLLVEVNSDMDSREIVKPDYNPDPVQPEQGIFKKMYLALT